MKKIIISLLLVLSLTAFAGCMNGGNVGDDAGDTSDTIGLMPRRDGDDTDRADNGGTVNDNAPDERDGRNDSGIIGDNGGLNNNDSRNGSVNNDLGNGGRSANNGNSAGGSGDAFFPDGIM